MVGPRPVYSLISLTTALEIAAERDPEACCSELLTADLSRLPPRARTPREKERDGLESVREAHAPLPFREIRDPAKTRDFPTPYSPGGQRPPCGVAQSGSRD
ncbi:MAG: hypothetical protein NVS1B9_01920 [Solirubrobacteraceae bacterium]